MSDDARYDVIIIGGGAAGLSAAMTLGRSRRRVLVVDNHTYRNRFAAHLHNVIAHDGDTPQSLREKSREGLKMYSTVHFADAAVTAITEDSTPNTKYSFAVRIADGQHQTVNGDVTCRRLIFACGVEDVLPDISGMAALWGHNVLHCPYCHGYEIAGGSWGLLAVPYKPATPPEPVVASDGAVEPMTIDAAALYHWTQHLAAFTNNLAVFTHGTDDFFDEKQLTAFKANGVRLYQHKIERVSKHGEQIVVHLVSGDDIVLDAMFVRIPFRHSPLIQQFKLKAHPVLRTVEVNLFGQSSNKRIYCAGDCMDIRAQLNVAMGSGAAAGAGVNTDLATEDWNSKLT